MTKKNGQGQPPEDIEKRWLSEVHIRHFKAAFRPKPVPLGPFNILIGRNGSGKSTLLEALQWIDATIRRDAREACDRYFGIQDLIHRRAQASRYFKIDLTWSHQEPVPSAVHYKVKVKDENGVPVIAKEELLAGEDSYLETKSSGERILSVEGAQIPFHDPDRLALGRLGTVLGHQEPALAFLESFWARAVFLRLSPNRIAQRSLAIRKSFGPLLDEEGQTLPALLNELTPDQQSELVQTIREVLPEIRGVRVSRADLGRDTQVNYSLIERRRSQIPSWMLSEGTRRITAILALLVREPAPSLLCIEEIENGLDPWIVRTVLRHLQSAADRGTQVILTTHSPWVLDDVPLESILQVRRIEGDARYEHFASRPELADFDPSLPPGTLYVNADDEIEYSHLPIHHGSP